MTRRRQTGYGWRRPTENTPCLDAQFQFRCPYLIFAYLHLSFKVTHLWYPHFQVLGKTTQKVAFLGLTRKISQSIPFQSIFKGAGKVSVPFEALCAGGKGAIWWRPCVSTSLAALYFSRCTTTVSNQRHIKLTWEYIDTLLFHPAGSWVRSGKRKGRNSSRLSKIKLHRTLPAVIVWNATTSCLSSAPRRRDDRGGKMLGLEIIFGTKKLLSLHSSVADSRLEQCHGHGGAKITGEGCGGTRGGIHSRSMKLPLLPAIGHWARSAAPGNSTWGWHCVKWSENGSGVVKGHKTSSFYLILGLF